ncbi:MAG: N-acetylmuramoyl-L-alanine amidase [Bacteroidia bacterium]|nr:N-acetylmuramoyl-L-alanine amidase [Bacteroidia bacterium]
MNEFLNYLLQVSALLIILYLPYQFLYRSETLFMANRFYLLAILIISWCIPFINIPFERVSPDLQIFSIPVQPPSLETYATSDIPPGNSGAGKLPHIFNWMLLYFAGACMMLIRNLWVIVRIIRLGQKSDRYRNRRRQIIVRDDVPAFSFFRNTFLSRTEYELAGNSLVYRHESAHVRQWHTLDLILAELIHTILWFNPILILYKKAVKETHEYLADRAVLNDGVEFESYATSLQSEFVLSRYQNLVNHFKGSTIKNRIIMATKTPDPKSIRKYFLIVPVLLGCLILWSFIQDPVSSGNPSVTERNLIVMIDPGHGGKDPGAINPSITESEKDFNLALAKNLETVPHTGIDFILTRNTDDFVTLADRFNLAEKTHADLFISLHMNANKSSKIRGSEFVYSSRNPFAEVSREICRTMGTQLQARVYGPNNEPFTTANLVVLSNCKCPSIHYSFGYITNDDDARAYSTNENLESLAKKIIVNLLEIKKEGVLPAK